MTISLTTIGTADAIHCLYGRPALITDDGDRVRLSIPVKTKAQAHSRWAPYTVVELSRADILNDEKAGHLLRCFPQLAEGAHHLRMLIKAASPDLRFQIAADLQRKTDDDNTYRNVLGRGGRGEWIEDD